MKFCKLEADEYSQFLQQTNKHFAQSRIHYDYLKNHNLEVHLLGVKSHDGTIIAAGLFTATHALKYFKYFYSQRGPMMDYSDVKLVRFFFKSLNAYLKKQRALYTRIDPYQLENIRTSHGEITHSFDNRAWAHTIRKLGYKHQGYTVGYSETSQIRWLSVLDLKGKHEHELLDDMDYQTRRNIKKTYEMGVQVRTLSYDETDIFYRLFKAAETKHGFKFRSKDYFLKLQDIFEDQIKMKLAYIDLNHYLESLQRRFTILKIEYNDVVEALDELPNSKRNKVKFQQVRQQYESVKRKIHNTERLREREGDILHLAAAIYIDNGDELYYFSSGSNPRYNAYMGAYRLQWEMIQYALRQGLPRFNFYGITGDFDEDADDVGVQYFKKGFNAHVEEYVGDFIKVHRPILYHLMKMKTKH
ncbi:aminoacyltransferase [Staphylococcus massiliensis]|uniref:aminoacyltransferase n=1 Tax=Staphylococcus massiliensis TaxID=555791 RepID=UPI001EDE70AA|nr:aminoacyltransferase [Staphylococcus massiliensis]MCG3411683.1 aminoacyltransferase [Staphylococcus massiliensis]